MSLYVIQDRQLITVPVTSFAQEAILERKHLQAMLRGDSSPLGEDLFVICEEFSMWSDSARRVDLLCLDKLRNLVVVEIKRTEDGGHMELQAIRYAAMVSSMTLEQAIGAHAKTLVGDEAVARATGAILGFLDCESVEDAELTGHVRAILVSADFSPEITTSVIWLNRQGLDIRCVRIKPYKLDGRLVIHVAQIIPLPEAADYEVKIREQGEQVRRAGSKRQETFRRFWGRFIEQCAKSTDLFRDRTPSSESWMGTTLGRAGFNLNVVCTEGSARVECFIRLGKDNPTGNKAAFRALYEKKDLIESAFGGPLDWQELPEGISSRVSAAYEDGGWKSSEAEWDRIHNWLTENAIRFEAALRPHILSLRA